MSAASALASDVAIPAGAAETPAASDGGEPLRFGVFELDLRAGELRRAGVLVRLSDQPFRLLSLLATRTGELVGRDEIRERLWGPDVHVEFDQGINTVVREVRRALRDDASSPRFVATVPRRGYRFVAPVERVAPAGDSYVPRSGAAEAETGGGPPTADAGSRWRRPLVAGLVAVLATATAYVVTPVTREVAHPRGGSVPVALAVVPFENVGAGAHEDDLGAALSEELIARLSRRFRGRLRVITPTAALIRRDPEADPGASARELGAEYLVTGAVRKSGEALRVSTRLVRVGDATVRWASTYQRDASGELEIQRRIAASISEALAVHILPRHAWSVRASMSGEAYAAYLRGLHRLQRARAAGRGGERALPDFERALELDPGFARAWIGLAQATLWKGRPTRRSQAMRYVSRGLALDDELAEGHLLRGELALYEDIDFDQALRSYRRALEIDPDSEAAHRALACWRRARAAAQGRSGEAVASGGTEARCKVATMRWVTTRAGSFSWGSVPAGAAGLEPLGARTSSRAVPGARRPGGASCPPAWVRASAPSGDRHPLPGVSKATLPAALP